ncbi:NUDIX hydrolase [Paenibacillus lautus]|uniref:NUDIX hydrolase n=1 Tax=Paenibacillus lautus TaxID=1401 RepID=UPI003D29557E
MEVGENLIDGLIREIKEESGIDVSVGSLVGVYSNTGIQKWYDGVTDVPTQVGFDFVCQPIGGELLSFSEETTDSRWVAKDRVLDLITQPSVRFRYQAYLEFNGAVNYADYVNKSPSLQSNIKHIFRSRLFLVAEQNGYDNSIRKSTTETLKELP